MIYYNMAAGFTIDAKFAAKMYEVDNITAIKWTSPNYFEMIKLKDMTNGGMNIINGPDEMLLMGLNAGADGGIGTTYNVQLKNIKSVYESFKAGNIAEAQKWQTLADRIINVIIKYKAIPATKAILEEMGFAVGAPTFPMTKYTAEEKAKIFEEVKAAGLVV